MADEAQIRVSLQIDKDNVSYRSSPTGFTADVSIGKGPTPGAITAAVTGTDIDFSQLTSLGWCHLRNLDDTNYVQFGVWNPDQSEFYPILRLLPGESVIVRLDPHLNQEYASTGTGTTGQLNTFRVKAANAPCYVLVEAFDA